MFIATSLFVMLIVYAAKFGGNLLQNNRKLIKIYLAYT